MDWNLVRTKLPHWIREPNPDLYLSQNYVVFDFETTTLSKGSALNENNRAVLACWWTPQGGHKHKWGGEYHQRELVRACQKADFVVAHNAKFDLQWMDRCGLDLGKVLVWDTMIAEYVVGGNRWVWRELSLGACGQRNFGEGKENIVSAMIKAGVDTPDIPEEWLLKYARQDVELTRKLFQHQRDDTAKALRPVVYTRCLVTPVLADMEKYGMQLDAEKVIPLTEQKELEYAQVMRELEEVSGGINTSSTPQLAKFLYEELKFEELTKWGKPVRTESGQPKTDQDTISKLTAKTAKQKKFLALYVQSKELYNELTKYLRKFRQCCEENGGVLRGSFNQTSTRTHRLSSTGAEYSTQFQNFPRAYKGLFCARRPGNLVAESDEAQLEFRTAVHLGRDRQGMEDIAAKLDVHVVTAGIIGCSRQDAKPHTFKPLYGGQSGTAQQQRYYKYFREHYSDITATQDRWINSVLTDGCLTTEWGLKYYWPTTKMLQSGYITNREAICNYPVQGFATAEIVPTAVAYMWHYIRAAELATLLLNTIHDSVVGDVPPDEIGYWHELSKLCLIDEVYDYLKTVYKIDLTVPLGCGVTYGDHWGAKNETKYEREVA